MKFKWSFVLLIPLLCFPFFIQADDNKIEVLVSANQKSKSPKIRATRGYHYGMAGCGVGSLFFEDPESQNQRFFQVLAVTTNNSSYAASTWGVGSSIAYSAGLSNCSEDEPHRAALNQEIYVAINKRQLEKETAQAAGPHLTALAKVLGCEDQVLQEFGAITQKAYGQIFEKDEPKIITEKYRFLVLNSEPLSSSCYKDL